MEWRSIEISVDRAKVGEFGAALRERINALPSRRLVPGAAERDDDDSYPQGTRHVDDPCPNHPHQRKGSIIQTIPSLIVTRKNATFKCRDCPLNHALQATSAFPST